MKQEKFKLVDNDADDDVDVEIEHEESEDENVEDEDHEDKEEWINGLEYISLGNIGLFLFLWFYQF